MATYDKATNYSTKTLLQQDNDSLESLLKYEVGRKPSCASSTFSTASTIEVVLNDPEKLKSGLSAYVEARNSKASLCEAWQRKLPTYYVGQTYPTVESYPPHRSQQGQTRHQKLYPSYKMTSSSHRDSGADLVASKLEGLKDRIVFRLGRITDLGIEKGMKAVYPTQFEDRTSSDACS